MATNNAVNEPTAASGKVLMGQGVGTTSAFSTSTYPNTVTSQALMYATGSNAFGSLGPTNSTLAAWNASGTLAARAFSINIQTFTSSGTYTPTTGMLYCIAEATGGGGGGGSASATGASTICAGGGGGGGGYCMKYFSASTIGSSQTVTIGVGGASATTGGNTTFGALLTANGGVGGNSTTAGATFAVNGANPGTSSGGSLNVNGGPGGIGFGTALNGFPGFGGNSPKYGCGAYPPTFQSGSGAGVGNSGQGYGSGGSGGSNGFNVGTPTAGGAGAGGLVVVTEYIIN